MMSRIVVLAVILGLWGCGNEAEVFELKTYVKTVQGFGDYNQRIEDYIAQFDDPSRQITQMDLDQSRQLVDEYAAAVADVPEPEENVLRNIHNLYVRSYADARRLARDQTGAETGDLKRQAHSIAIGMRNLRRVIEDRVYLSIDILLAREHIEGDEWKLSWPEAKR